MIKYDQNDFINLPVGHYEAYNQHRFPMTGLRRTCLKKKKHLM